MRNRPAEVNLDPRDPAGVEAEDLGVAKALAVLLRALVGDEHGVANQQAALDKYAAGRGWTITRRLSDNDLSASNGVHRPGYDEVLRLVDAGQVD